MRANTVVYLIGPPGVGKLTVGRLLAGRLGFRLVDNHSWLNLIFGLIRQDGTTPLPEAVWPLVARMRDAVLETIATLSPPDWSFIFTHAAFGDDDAADRKICDAITTTARRRGAAQLAVRLTCAPDELARRMQAPERSAMMKHIDPAAAYANAAEPLFDPRWPHTLTIDTTGLTADQTADRIIDAL